MGKTTALLLFALIVVLIPIRVMAEERVVDGAGGALAGVLVAGPIGALAGGVIGVFAGPDIARGMGLKGHRHYHYVHHTVTH
ncbi:MAG: hypothetical protein ABSC72_10740 [Methylovirgula sp.]|jgi:hypothetical protein